MAQQGKVSGGRGRGCAGLLGQGPKKPCRCRAVTHGCMDGSPMGSQPECRYEGVGVRATHLLQGLHCDWPGVPVTVPLQDAVEKGTSSYLRSNRPRRLGHTSCLSAFQPRRHMRAHAHGFGHGSHWRDGCGKASFSIPPWRAPACSIQHVPRLFATGRQSTQMMEGATHASQALQPSAWEEALTLVPKVPLYGKTR